MAFAMRCLPAITVLGVNIGWLIGATVIIENVFAIPGLGQLMIFSVSARDYPTIQAVTLVFAVLVVLVNLATRRPVPRPGSSGPGFSASDRSIARPIAEHRFGSASPGCPALSSSG